MSIRLSVPHSLLSRFGSLAAEAVSSVTPSAFVYLSALVIAGCSTVERGQFRACELKDTGADGLPQITMLFATNRTRDSTDLQTGPSFGIGRSNTLTYGRLLVTLPADYDRAFGSIDRFRLVGEVLDSETSFSAAVRSGESAHSMQPSGAPILLFIHGYNESFERSARRFAQVVHDGCLNVVPILFAWPSRDGLLDYVYDLDSATFSRRAFLQLLTLVTEAGGSRVTDVMAHSMGNWIALEALRNYATSFTTIRIKSAHTRRLGTLLFASPDVDLDVFRQEISEASAAGRLSVLLTSHDDFLLSLSTFLAHGLPRAGYATAQDLDNHKLSNSNDLIIIQMDQDDLGDCPGGSHRCAETNQNTLQRIRTLLIQTNDSEDF